MLRAIYLLMLIAGYFCNQLCAQVPKSDSIVAIVNDEIITYQQVYDKIRETIAGIEKSSLPRRHKELKKRELFTLALRHLVDEKLILHEARHYKITITEENIREQLEKEVKKHGAPLKTGEIDVSDLVRTRLTIQELLQKKASYSKNEEQRAIIDTFVTPREMKEYYQKNIAQFTRENKIKVRIITLYYFRSGGREQALAKAEAIVAQLREGADFAEMARLYSDDPYKKHGGTWPRIERDGKMEWDFFKRGSGLYEEVESVAFALEQGQVSDPIPVDSQEYCQIVKIEAVEPGGVTPFAEVHESIQQKLRQQKILAALGRMRYRLRQRAFIWPPNLFMEQ